jgi:hypothetical protein
MTQYRDEVVIQQHRYQINKVPGFGFGLAVSGGIDNSEDGPVVISDVIENGPAHNKLQINDIVIIGGTGTQRYPAVPKSIFHIFNEKSRKNKVV